MSDYWIDSPDNPFNQMDYTRGGGGYDNRQTHESNDRRAEAMQGAGAAALPHFANVGVAQAYYPGKGLAVVDGNVIRTTGPGAPSANTVGGVGGAGAGSAGVASSSRAGGKGAGSRLVIGGPLTPTMNANVTEMMVGGDWWKSNPWFSDAEEYTKRYGESEIAEMAFFLTNVGADTVFNTARGWNALGEWAKSQNRGGAADAGGQPVYDNGWVSYDEGASWSFAAKDGTEPFMWDTGGRNPSVNPFVVGR